MLSVIPEWIFELPFQQQSVLLLATRGPDGIAKEHPCKRLVRIYRGTVYKNAKYGRLSNERDFDTFTDRRPLLKAARRNFEEWDFDEWKDVIDAFLGSIDELPLHYVMHFMHGVEILGYHCPDIAERALWNYLYLRMVTSLHLEPESKATLDQRLGDWGRVHWDE